MMATNKWVLYDTYDGPVSRVFLFSLESHRHWISLETLDGRVVVTNRGQVMGLKPRQRIKVERAYYAAMAYYSLTGSIDGFPKQELL